MGGEPRGQSPWLTQKIIMNQNKIKTINEVLSEIKTDGKVLEMKNYIQHGSVSTYEHCENVVSLSYDLDKWFRLHSNLDTLLKGAMLHDFYLYDWHEDGDGSHRLHGFSHPGKAAENAEKFFDTNREINHVIASHMWPLTPVSVPTSREAWVICLADKMVSLYETVFRR